MRLLEEFWYGNIEPTEYDTSSNKEYKKLVELIYRNEENHKATMTDKQKIVSNKNDELMQLFHHTCEKNGIVHDNRKIFEYLSTFETKCDNVQLSLFDKDFAGKSPNGI